jgi:hypothetical protein
VVNRFPVFKWPPEDNEENPMDPSHGAFNLDLSIAVLILITLPFPTMRAPDLLTLFVLLNPLEHPAHQCQGMLELESLWPFEILSSESWHG